MLEKKKKPLNSYIIYSSLSIQIAVIIMVGAFLGDYLDRKTQSNSPIYTAAFSVVSFFLALYYVLKKTIANDKKK